MSHYHEPLQGFRQRNSPPQSSLSGCQNALTPEAADLPLSNFLFNHSAVSARHSRRTAMRLRPNEFPGTHSQTEADKTWSAADRRSAPPRGYRKLRSPAEMRKLLNRKIVEQDRKCAICHEEFTHYNDIVPDHKDPKGMGGAWRDDHPDNIQATHWWCNEEKGSTRVDG